MIIHKSISSDGSELVPTTDAKINLTLPILQVSLEVPMLGEVPWQIQVAFYEPMTQPTDSCVPTTIHGTAKPYLILKGREKRSQPVYMGRPVIRSRLTAFNFILNMIRFWAACPGRGLNRLSPSNDSSRYPIVLHSESEWREFMSRAVRPGTTIYR
jgi:hypothetical protein